METRLIRGVTEDLPDRAAMAHAIARIKTIGAIRIT
jgi:hypothetical protein